MDELQSMLAESAKRLFKDTSETEYRPGAFNQASWDTVQELGFPDLLRAEINGGIGGTWSHAMAVLRPAGYYTVALPCGESMLAAYLMDRAGLEPTGGLVVACPSQGTLTAADNTHRFTGRVRGVPWGRYADAVVTAAELEGRAHVVVLSPGSGRVEEALNLAGEPRDELYFDGCNVQAASCDAPAAARINEYCALLRLAQIVGALERALSLSVDYANERKQFGRTIAKFQAVQQQLAVFGADVAAVTCAVRSAFDAADAGDARFQIAAAKLRANMAIGAATAAAHQVHAAIGFTWEHPLRLATQRLLSWRSEYGNDAYWSRVLGTSIAARGADNFWNDLTERDDAVLL